MVKKGYILLFAATTLFFWFALYAYVPVVGQYATLWDASPTMVGLISGAYGFTQMILRIPLGIASDKTGRRKPFMLMGIGFALVAGLVVALWQSPYSLLAARALAGFGAAAWVPFTVLFASYFPPDRASRGMGIINAVNNGGQFLGSLSCGFAVALFGTTGPFWVTAVVGICAAAMCAFVYEKKPGEGGVSREPLKLREIFAVAKNKHILIVGLLGILSQYVSFSGIFGFTPLVAVENYGSTSGDLSLLTAINTFAAMGGAMFCAMISAKIKPARLSLACFIVNGICYIGLPALPSFAALCCVQGVIGFCNSCGFTVLLALCLEGVEPRLRASAMGFFQAVYALGMTGGPIITGAIRDMTGSYMIAYAALAVVCFIAAAIAGVYFRKDIFGK